MIGGGNIPWLDEASPVHRDVLFDEFFLDELQILYYTTFISAALTWLNENSTICRKLTTSTLYIESISLFWVNFADCWSEIVLLHNKEPLYPLGMDCERSVNSSADTCDLTSHRLDSRIW
jgi:hypothetical protein